MVTLGWRGGPEQFLPDHLSPEPDQRGFAERYGYDVLSAIRKRVPVIA